MAVLALTDASITINSVSLGNRANSVSINYEIDSLESTAFGSVGHSFVGGLQNLSVEIALMQDFAASAVEQTIYPLIGSTAVAFEILPNGTAVGTANPKYTGSLIVTDWTPVAGAVGELLTASVTWPITGAIVKDVTP